jgi:hypothetical protein
MFTQKRLAALTLGLFLTAPAMAANKVSFAFTTIDVPGAAATTPMGTAPMRLPATIRIAAASRMAIC